MTTDREQFVVDLPIAMKDALGAYAAEHRMPMTEAARFFIAQGLGIEYGGLERAGWTRTRLEIPQSERAALKRWAAKAVNTALTKGDVEAATLIATAERTNDYDTMIALKNAAEAPKGTDNG